MSRPSFQRLDEVLRSVLGKSPLQRGLREQEVLAAWPEIVGTEIARHSRALGLENGVLWISAESSVWAQELSLLKPRIQQSLDEELGAGTIREIRFSTGKSQYRNRG